MLTTTTPLLIGLVVALIALIIAICTMPSSRPHTAGRPIQDYTPPTDTLLWTFGHDAPAYPMTVERAHREMQWHRGCRRSKCARKDAAYMTLVDAGHIRPRVEAHPS